MRGSQQNAHCLILEPVEVELLQALITEYTFAKVAERIGYSERQARRLAARVVDRLGAQNRYGAIAIAVQLGLLSHELASNKATEAP